MYEEKRKAKRAADRTAREAKPKQIVPEPIDWELKSINVGDCGNGTYKVIEMHDDDVATIVGKLFVSSVSDGTFELLRLLENGTTQKVVSLGRCNTVDDALRYWQTEAKAPAREGETYEDADVRRYRVQKFRVLPLSRIARKLADTRRRKRWAVIDANIRSTSRLRMEAVARRYKERQEQEAERKEKQQRLQLEALEAQHVAVSPEVIATRTRAEEKQEAEKDKKLYEIKHTIVTATKCESVTEQLELIAKAGKLASSLLPKRQ